MQAQAVAGYLMRMGFTNVVIAPNRMLVSADGTADSARAAFLTSFSRVKTQEGRIAFANNSDAHVPTALQGSVLSVIGLQDVYQAHTLIQRLQSNTTAGATVTGHNPTEFSSIYGGTGVATAAGVTIGIVSEGDLTQTLADLNTYTTNNGLATVTTQIVDTNGTSGDTGNTDEWDLDSQTVVGVGGGQVGKIIFYRVPSLENANIVADLNTAMTANAAKIINVSLGECETSANSDGLGCRGGQDTQGCSRAGPDLLGRDWRLGSRRVRRVARHHTKLASFVALYSRGRRHPAQCHRDDMERRDRLEQSDLAQRRHRRQSEHLRTQAKLGGCARPRDEARS